MRTAGGSWGRSEPVAGRGRVVAAGYDTVVEAFDLGRFAEVEVGFLAAKASAAAATEASAGGGDRRSVVEVGGERLFVSGRGAAGGIQVWADAEDGAFTLQLRSPKMSFSTVVRYNSVGLWLDGLESLRNRVFNLLSNIGKFSRTWDCERWVGVDGSVIDRISRADYAIDIYSEEFHHDMIPDIVRYVVAHQESKQRMHCDTDTVSRSGKIETLTIGRKSSCQIQVYDKGREILEQSHKSWMADIWRTNGYSGEIGVEKVYRLEVRLASEYLRERDIRYFDELKRDFSSVFGEALFKRRLVTFDGCDRKDLRPMHWLWGLALEQIQASAEWRPLGRVFRGDANRLCDQLVKQAAGVLRLVSTVATGGTADLESVADLAVLTCRRDEEADEKEDRIMAKYGFCDARKFACNL